MKYRRALVVLLASCGTLPVSDDDGGGTDAGIDTSVGSDVQASDVTIDVGADAGVDTGVDATLDAASEAACFTAPDAKADGYVNIDAATVGWATDLGNGNVWASAVDPKGNILLGGSAHQSSDERFYLQELDSAGNTVWSVNVGSSNSYPTHLAWGVSFDDAGNMYGAGETSDQIDLGGGKFGPGAFVVKYDAKGAFQWNYGPFPKTQFRQVRVKSNGNVVIAGILKGTENFGGGSIGPTGGNDALVVEVTSCMSFVRAKNWGDSGTQEIYGLALDSSDNIFVGGRFESAIDFGGGTMSGPTAGSGTFNLFIAKLDASEGYLHQLNTATTTTNGIINALATDSSGNVFVTGVDADTVNLGGSTLTATGSYDAFIGELDGSLGHKWSKHYASSSAVLGWSVVADPTGGVAMTGQYNGSNLNFGQGALPSGQGLYIVQFDSSGNSLRSWGAAASAASQATAFVAWPDFVIAGQCSGSVAFPSGTLTCTLTGTDAFAARLKP